MSNEETARLHAVGGARLWIEQGSIRLKAVSRTGNGVELTPDEARRLGEALLRMANDGEPPAK